jgi:TPR repeat protein
MALRFGLALFIVFALVACAPAHAGPREDAQQAETSLRNGDLITAMNLLRRASDQGYAPAQARLADLLDAAEYNSDAVALYRKAAEQGDAAGEYGLGRMYAAGEGVARDAAQALAWFRRAADKNHPDAVEALARAHKSGDLGLARDTQQAAELDARAQALRKQAKDAAK